MSAQRTSGRDAFADVLGVRHGRSGHGRQFMGTTTSGLLHGLVAGSEQTDIILNELLFRFEEGVLTAENCRELGGSVGALTAAAQLSTHGQETSRALLARCRSPRPLSFTLLTAFAAALQHADVSTASYERVFRDQLQSPREVASATDLNSLMQLVIEKPQAWPGLLQELAFAWVPPNPDAGAPLREQFVRVLAQTQVTPEHQTLLARLFEAWPQQSQPDIPAREWAAVQRWLVDTPGMESDARLPLWKSVFTQAVAGNEKAIECFWSQQQAAAARNERLFLAERAFLLPLEMKTTVPDSRSAVQLGGPEAPAVALAVAGFGCVGSDGQPLTLAARSSSLLADQLDHITQHASAPARTETKETRVVGESLRFACATGLSQLPVAFVNEQSQLTRLRDVCVANAALSSELALARTVAQLVPQISAKTRVPAWVGQLEPNLQTRVNAVTNVYRAALHAGDDAETAASGALRDEATGILVDAWQAADETARREFLNRALSSGGHLLDPFPPAMQQQSYTNWLTVADIKTVVRAAVDPGDWGPQPVALERGARFAWGYLGQQLRKQLLESYREWVRDGGFADAQAKKSVGAN